MTATEPVMDEVFAPTLSGEEYTAVSVFERELEQIFEQDWVLVGRADGIPDPGDFLRVNVGRESVIVVRGRDGNIRSFLNVCRHRGARLCLEENGSVGRAIRCPYHAWTYGLDGSLITAPNWEAMSTIDKAEKSLIDVRTTVWENLIWVNLSDDDRPLMDALNPQFEFRLAGDMDVIGRYDLGSLKLGRRIVYEVEANWKLIFENFQECYHCGTIHPELVEAIPEFQASDAAGDGYNTDGYAFAEGREAFTMSGNRTIPRLPGLREDDDYKYFGMVLRPNAFLSLTPDHAITHTFEPLSPTRTRATCDWLFAPEVVDSGEYNFDDSVSLFDTVNQQDFKAAEWCQLNMKSRGYANGGVLAPSEQFLIGRWYEWYKESMARD